ncbi:hypothetical protein MSAN_01744900 [Mycena sanguinolenta]|uniref:Uncharacterized protein n=1 Tax=Mycena sanguinolenta TaxID=230812 RepID=A0A8H6XWJ2_9AGAR|nr:hypothetical protein MSAN_01744900 [Mycena sanguinolenta]
MPGRIEERPHRGRAEEEEIEVYLQHGTFKHIKQVLRLARPALARPRPTLDAVDGSPPSKPFHRQSSSPSAADRPAAFHLPTAIRPIRALGWSGSARRSPDGGVIAPDPRKFLIEDWQYGLGAADSGVHLERAACTNPPCSSPLETTNPSGSLSTPPLYTADQPAALSAQCPAGLVCCPCSRALCTFAC